MLIEKLNKKDIESYKNLIDICFGGSNQLEYYLSSYKENNNYEIIVIKDKNIIIGSLTYYKIDLFTFSFQPCLEIFNVAVLPEYRSKKIAKELFLYLIDYAKKDGYKSIYLTCLDTANNAHRLYESVGFKKMDSLKYSMVIGDV